MSDSLTFNSVDMSSYGLVVREIDLPFARQVGLIQLKGKAHGLDTLHPALNITIDVIISAASKAAMDSNLDSIRAALNSDSEEVLALDAYDDRYWLARCVSMEGPQRYTRVWKGTIIFICSDPAAFDNDLTSNDHTVDEDPEEFTETVGGTEKLRPVLTLTCDDTLTDTTVIITNFATGEALTWEGSLVSEDELEIDCDEFIVKLNGEEDMADVSGQFPQLLVGANVIQVEGFSGNCNIAYRKRYA